MPYRYLEEIATADVAFEAWGETLEELFATAADAMMNVMVEELETIADQERQVIRVEDGEIDLLLFQFLQELIFFKDARELLLRVPQIRIERQEDHYTLTAEAYGEKLDPNRHDLRVDVKAVTLHRFRVEKTLRGWEATVILDI